PRARLRPHRDPRQGPHPARRVDRRDPREPPPADRRAERSGCGRTRARRDPGEPYRTSDVAARTCERPRLRLALGAPPGRPRGDRARLPRPARAAGARRRGGAPVIWVGWRLQRTEALVALGILALVALLLVPTGLHMAGVYDDNGIAACVGTHSSACANAVDDFRHRFERLVNLIGWLNLVPGVIGILLAAPVLLELDQGTYRLAWTQSIT